MAEPLTVGYGVNKWVKNADTKTLNVWTTGATGYNPVNLTINSVGTATVYQVPAGKKFIMLLISQKSAWSGDVKVFHSTSTGTITNNSSIQVAYFQSIANFDYDCYFEVPAGKYINIYTSHPYSKVQVYGVETNA